MLRTALSDIRSIMNILFFASLPACFAQDASVPVVFGYLLLAPWVAGAEITILAAVDEDSEPLERMLAGGVSRLAAFLRLALFHIIRGWLALLAGGE